MTGPVSREEWARLRAATTTNVDELVAQVGLPSVLLPYQADAVAVLESGTGLVVIEKSRRVGLTWALASAAVLRASREKAAGGMDAMYISYSQEMTREFIDACAMWARAFSLGAMEAGEFLFDDVDPAAPSETRQIKAFRIQFASGFEVLALSSAPRGLRGKQGLVIIDEAAFVDNLAELLKAALAFLMWGGQVVVCSTHNGVDNAFNTLVQDVKGEKRPGVHRRIDFDQALIAGLHQRICLVTGKDWSPEAEAKWRQDIVDYYAEGADEELFCIPAQGTGTWLTAPLIEARMTLAPEDAPVIRISLPDNYLFLDPVQRRHLFEPQLDEVKKAMERCRHDELHAAGYDPARKRDPAVITLLAIEKLLRRRSVLTVEMRNVPFDEQKRVARVIFVAPRMIGAAVDATGMGMNLAEDLGREFGLRADEASPGLVWPITLNSGWYNENLPPLKTAFEDDMIALARDLEHQTDLRLVKIIRGIPMVPAEREGTAGNKRHGDFAVALGLAHFASRMQWREYGYEPVPAGSTDGGGQRGFWNAPDELYDLPARDPWSPPLGAAIRGGGV